MSATGSKKVSSQMEAVMRVMMGKEERTIADKLADPNRPTWEQYKKDNEDKLNLSGVDHKKMEEYRRELDEERDRILSRGSNHRKKKKSKKKKKKRKYDSDSDSDDSHSNEEDRRRARKHKKSKKRKKKRRQKSSSSDESSRSSDEEDRQRKKKKRKKGKNKDDEKDRYRLSSFFNNSDSDTD
mmetsp:Transcript_18268/g.21084  ORF Transcript_18268/g.21084 Transcript_18268/m.21084 type:complete len:183 (+) Transcript_18268:209-757(+)